MYKVLYENPNEDIFERLLKIRNIEVEVDSFLNPKLSEFRIDPYKLNDMNKAVERIVFALKNNEKIMIFWDYDVDWISSSYLLYTFFTKYLWYKNISIRLPNRLKDWYWIKYYHLDEIKKSSCSLVITVDNWITAVEEANHAKSLWIDFIITDHHKALDKIPDAFAIINPQVSPEYWFKWISWVWVAFKLATALSNKLIKSSKHKKEMMNYLLPIVAIWTVADCVPLIWENRLMVKMWLDYINNRTWVPQSILNYIDFLNIKNNIDSFHIWFMIAPRLNAWWRMWKAYDSLYSLMINDYDKQKKYLEKIENYNIERKKIQEEIVKNAEKMINKDEKILIAYSEDFHEWIIWIVSWRISEKYNKPSIILSVDKEKWVATASLRWPEYFNIVDLLNHVWKYLIRYWWHKQAWWLTVKLENLESLIQDSYNYCEKIIKDKQIDKEIFVDTPIYENELNNWKLWNIINFWPFWESNPEPIFLISNSDIIDIEKVWKNWNWHLKLRLKKWESVFSSLFRWKGDTVDNFTKNENRSIVWKVKKDTYNWWFYIDWNYIFSNE